MGGEFTYQPKWDPKTVLSTTAMSIPLAPSKTTAWLGLDPVGDQPLPPDYFVVMPLPPRARQVVGGLALSTTVGRTEAVHAEGEGAWQRKWSIDLFKGRTNNFSNGKMFKLDGSFMSWYPTFWLVAKGTPKERPHPWGALKKRHTPICSARTRGSNPQTTNPNHQPFA